MSIVQGSDLCALWEESHRLDFTHHMMLIPMRSTSHGACYRLSPVISTAPLTQAHVQSWLCMMLLKTACSQLLDAFALKQRYLLMCIQNRTLLPLKWRNRHSLRDLKGIKW